MERTATISAVFSKNPSTLQLRAPRHALSCWRTIERHSQFEESRQSKSGLTGRVVRRSHSRQRAAGWWGTTLRMKRIDIWRPDPNAKSLFHELLPSMGPAWEEALPLFEDVLDAIRSPERPSRLSNEAIVNHGRWGARLRFKLSFHSLSPRQVLRSRQESAPTTARSDRHATQQHSVCDPSGRRNQEIKETSSIHSTISGPTHAAQHACPLSVNDKGRHDPNRLYILVN